MSEAESVHIHPKHTKCERLKHALTIAKAEIKAKDVRIEELERLLQKAKRYLFWRNVKIQNTVNEAELRLVEDIEQFLSKPIQQDSEEA